MISHLDFIRETVLHRSKARWLKVPKWSGLSTRSWRQWIHHLAYTSPIVSYPTPGGCVWQEQQINWTFSLWWLPGNAALWPLEGEIDSTSWHCLSFVPSSKQGKKKKEGSQQRQASALFPSLHIPSSFPASHSFPSHIPAHKHTRTADNTECNSLVCCHIQPLNSQMTSFWRRHNSIQCLSICSGSGNMLSEEIFIHSAAMQPHKSPHPTWQCVTAPSPNRIPPTPAQAAPKCPHVAPPWSNVTTTK